MNAMIEEIGTLALQSRSLEIVKELLTKLYNRRFAEHFSDAALCLVLGQIRVSIDRSLKTL